MHLSHEEIRSKVNKAVQEHTGVEPARITPNADFHADLGCDSLDMVELTMAFEEDLGIEISDAEAESVNTVEDAYNLLSKKIGG